MTNRTDARRAGVDRLDAVELPDGHYAYLAPETGSWYHITEYDICDLGEALLADEDDAYSVWCASCGDEIDDTDHDQLDQIASVRRG